MMKIDNIKEQYPITTLYMYFVDLCIVVGHQILIERNFYAIIWLSVNALLSMIN